VRADSRTWIVGARPGAAGRAVARRFGARSLGRELGIYVVAKPRARAFAGALRARRLLVFADADRVSHRFQAVPDDPLSNTPWNWRSAVADPAAPAPPAVTAQGPLLALVDAELDKTHPEWTGDANVTTLGRRPLTNSHGTATASVATAPANGIGIVGVYPGARTLNLPLPDEIRCRDSTRQILRAVEQRAKVINMSYGSPDPCQAEYVALQYAVGRDVVLVAAAGNEGDQGNSLQFPATFPHVVTVAAVDPSGQHAPFSESNPAVDLSAPGVAVMTAVPPQLDTADGSQDGYEAQSGTSFAAPMAAGAALWRRAADPALSGYQTAQKLRLGAAQHPLGAPGWDPQTGYGLLSVASSLGVGQIPDDPLEPNDNIVWVDGDAFDKPDRAIYGGRRPVSFSAQLDAYEDPADVYRVVVRAHRTARVTATPTAGDIELEAFDSRASTIARTRGRVGRSARRGTVPERLTLRNRTARSKVFFAALGVQRGGQLNASYTISVR
jgi:hypothetical protein